MAIVADGENDISMLPNEELFTLDAPECLAIFVSDSSNPENSGGSCLS
ncbi:MAG: hypothetical protein IPL69_19715 [Saprospiraceae bacterium]|nr:hypothetical protein [Candidatus Brachybacter algidus]